MKEQDEAASQRTVPYPVFQRERERRIKAEQLLAWERKLWKNRQLNPAHKLGLVAMKDAIERAQTHDEQGRARINLNTMAEDIGMSSDTMSRTLKKFAKQIPGFVDVTEKAEIQENGERWTRKYVSLNDEMLQTPDQLTPIVPRAHGGNHYTCQKCGSDKIRIKKRITIVCKCCKHESLIEETERDQESTQDQEAKNFDELDRNLRDIIKPVTPPYGAGCDEASATPVDDKSKMLPGHLPDTPVDEKESEVDRDDLQAAAALLLALAGQAEEHIEMSRTGQKKYYTVARPLTLDDCIDHLQGGQARGAPCSCTDGQTRGLGFDADDAERWEILKAAARQLAEAGYLPILEPSPADRGGHLWLIYSALVDAAAARQHALEIAPDLADIAEYWPGPQDAPKWNRVRLPGGKYVRRGQYVETPVNAWCQLFAVATGESSSDGASAARLLLGNQTPAQIVPEIHCQDDDQDDQVRDVAQQSELELPALHLVTPPAEEMPNSDDQDSDKSKMLPGQVDTQWHARYNTPEGKRLWFAWTPAQLATWYNERHSLEETRPRERNKMALSPNGDERTASTAYYSTGDGERWTDFSTHGHRADGTRDTGDALELQQRLTGTPKPELMREAARELLQLARQELEQAARAGQALPTWLEEMEMITPAGYEHYARIAEQAGHQDQAEQIRATCHENAGRIRHEKTLRNDDQVQPSTPEALACEVEECADQQEQTESRQDDEASADMAGGVTGFLPPNEADSAGILLPGAGERQLREPALAVPSGIPLTDEIAAMMQERGLTHGAPCSKCACELERDLYGQRVCVRCYPTKGYHQLSDLVDRMYPRRQRLQLGEWQQEEKNR